MLSSRCLNHRCRWEFCRPPGTTGPEVLSNSNCGCSVPTSTVTVGRVQQRQKVLLQGPWAPTAQSLLQESQGGAGRWTMPRTILSGRYRSTYGVRVVTATFFLLSFLFLLVGEWEVPVCVWQGSGCGSVAWKAGEGSDASNRPVQQGVIGALFLALLPQFPFWKNLCASK